MVKRRDLAGFLGRLAEKSLHSRAVRHEFEFEVNVGRKENRIAFDQIRFPMPFLQSSAPGRFQPKASACWPHTNRSIRSINNPKFSRALFAVPNRIWWINWINSCPDHRFCIAKGRIPGESRYCNEAAQRPDHEAGVAAFHTSIVLTRRSEVVAPGAMSDPRARSLYSLYASNCNPRHESRCERRSR